MSSGNNSYNYNQNAFQSITYTDSATLVANIVDGISQKVGSNRALAILEDYMNTGLKD